MAGFISAIVTTVCMVVFINVLRQFELLKEEEKKKEKERKRTSGRWAGLVSA